MIALQTLQAYLDDTGRLMLDEDFDGFCARVSLPFTLVTESTTLVVNDRQDLRHGFDTFASMLRLHRVTDYIRLADSAVLLDEALISGRYVSHILAGALRVVPPYNSTILLRREDNLWRAVSIANTIRNAQWPIVVMDVPDTPTPKLGRQPP